MSFTLYLLACFGCFCLGFFLCALLSMSKDINRDDD